jgi:two-component system, OmpR family, sensor kinase
VTVRLRLALNYVVAITVTIGLIGVLVWWQVDAALRGSLDQTLETRAIAVATELENNGQSGLQQGNASGPPTVFVAIFDSGGALLDSTAGVPPALTRPLVAAGGGELRLAGTTYATFASEGPGGVTVVAGSSLASVDATLARLTQSLVILGAAAAIASLAGGWWLAGRALRPVALITAEARQIGAVDIERRLPVPARRDELWALATTLNDMLDRVGDALRRQRSFVAAASHDLRSPIAALQAELELADDDRTTDLELRKALRAAHADTIRLGELASGLLDLATVDADGRDLVRTGVNLAGLVDAVVRRVEPLARERDVRVSATAPQVFVRVDRVRLEQALSNLVVNAITYGPAGGTVEVVALLDVVQPEPAGGAQTHLVVEVMDRGPGLPAEVAAGAFEPFRRGPNAVGPGAGLGLATAAAAIRAHHGSIGYVARVGGGTRFWIRLPV